MKYSEQADLSTSEVWVTRGWGVIASGYRVSVGADESILNLDLAMVAQLCKYIKKH